MYGIDYMNRMDVGIVIDKYRNFHWPWKTLYVMPVDRFHIKSLKISGLGRFL